MTRPTPLYRAYTVLTRVVLPFAALIETRKLRKAGVDARRAREKRGFASERRPSGQIIWFHAASVGESLSVLSLIARMGQALPDARFLITSGTATSAALVGKRLPPRCLHQFAPLDAPGPIKRFLAHWQPAAAIFVESELWPQMLWRSHSAGIPLALVNARMSARSAAGWAKRAQTAAMVLSVFRLFLTQNAQMARTLAKLGAPEDRIVPGVNLKSLSAPLPQHPPLVEAMQNALQGRPVWVASSTHAGEEKIVLRAHEHLLKSHPDLCLILAPRHPDRSDEVAALITEHGWPDLRRSADALPLPAAPVYLADTLGELGTWYALSDMVFLGGSLLPIGGHNPFEVAQAEAAVLSGAHVSNFAETFSGLEAAGGAVLVSGEDDLARSLDHWLRDPGARAAVTQAARAYCAAQTGALDAVAQQLIDRLDLDQARPYG